MLSHSMLLCWRELKPIQLELKTHISKLLRQGHVAVSATSVWFSLISFSSVWKEFEKEANIVKVLMRQLCVFVCLCFNPVHRSSNLRPALLTVFPGLVLLVHPVHQRCVRVHLLFIQGHHHGGPSPPPSSPWSSNAPTTSSSSLVGLLRLLLLVFVLLPALRVLAGWVGAGGGEGGELVAQFSLGGNLETDLCGEGLNIWTWEKEESLRWLKPLFWKVTYQDSSGR